MNQILKTTMLLIALIGFSIFAFQFFNENEIDPEIISEPIITTSTTEVLKNVEQYKQLSIPFETFILTTLEQIDVECEKFGSWYGLTGECLSQWQNGLNLIENQKEKYLNHYEYTKDYFLNNYQNIPSDQLESILSSLQIYNSINYYMEQLDEVKSVVSAKSNQQENLTTIFLSDEAIKRSKNIGTTDLLSGCYKDSNIINDESTEWLFPENVNLRDNKKINYAIKVESTLDLDPTCLKNLLFLILNNEQGWQKLTEKPFQITNEEDSDFVYIFASPDKTDELCFPLETNGIYSCRNETEVVINEFRWKNGAVDFQNDMEMYRIYLINHETGHVLGWEHIDCPKEGAVAPLMLQQSKGTFGCIPYGWPVYESVIKNFED